MENLSTSEIISNILEKYGIKEGEADLAKKFLLSDKDSYSNRGTILWLAEKLKDNKITEEEYSRFLTDKLFFNKNISDQIVLDIKNILLPVLKGESATIPKPNKSAQLNQSFKKPLIEEDSKEVENKTPFKKTKKNNEFTPPKKSGNKNNRADKYLEPIE